MALSKISQMTVASSLSGPELFEITQSGSTLSTTTTQISTFVQGQMQSTLNAKLPYGLVENTDTTTTAGIVYPPLSFMIQHFNPTLSPAGAIRFGAISRYEYESSQSNSGAGHHVAHLAWYVHQGSGNPNMALAHEAKFDNETTATITVGIGSESQLSGNAGTISNFYGHRSRVTSNNGTIGNFVGYRPEVSTFTGTMGSAIGFEFPDMSGLTNTIRSAIVNRDPSAPILSAAPIIDQSLTYSSPSATGFTVTIPDYKTVLLLTPSAAYAAGTVNLPSKAHVSDGQTIEITCSQPVTAITWGLNGSAWILNGPTALTSGQTVRFRYFLALDWWVRV